MTKHSVKLDQSRSMRKPDIRKMVNVTEWSKDRKMRHRRKTHKNSQDDFKKKKDNFAESEWQLNSEKMKEKQRDILSNEWDKAVK